MIADIERARRALQAIPPDVPRDEWVRVLMAGQAAGLDADELRAWSEQGNTYEARAFADTMRSIKPGKGIGAGTLHRLAAEHGHQSPSEAPIRPVVRPQTVRQGFTPADVWSRCKPATPSHRYVVRKLGGGGPELAKLRVLPEDDALRIAGQNMAGALVVPAYGPEGLQSLQLIPPPGAGKKMNLPGAPMAGASFTVGTPAPGEPLYLCEGIGQAWAVWQATGRAAVCCFGWGNVGTVARAIHERDNAARLVLVPDVGKEEAAERIARELGCSVACMPEGEASNFDANDLAQRDGHDVLAELLEGAQDFAPRPLLVPVDVARVLSEPSEPPRFVWDGYLPRGVVAMLGAHGGTGKSTIALMLAVAVAAGRGELFGVACEPGRVVFASLEDSAAVVRHRLHKICTAWGIEPHALAQRLSIVDGTSEPELFASTGRDGGSTTPAYAELRALAQGCDLLMIDNASDAYGGDEIQRRPVRGFIRALGRIAKANDCAVLLLAHVDKGTSRKERADTEGYSGSTAWNNSVRSRLFMARGNDGALELSHQKSNLAKLRAPLRLFWPDGGLPQVDAAPVGVVAHIADNVNTRALLKLIAEFSERGEHVSTATTSRSNAAALLSAEAGYPKALKPREVFDLLRRAERAGHIERVVQRTANRKPLECWQVTSKGREHAELAPTAPAAPTARFEEVGAPDAEGAPTAPTSAGGYRGRESAQEVGAPAGAGTGADTAVCADFTDEGAADVE